VTEAAPGTGFESHVVEVRAHGRYLLRPALGAAAGILVGFHGYMESAEPHLDALATIPGSASWNAVAVDALHAFYARSSGSGRVVRGWLTSDLRSEAIADNVRYIGGVLDAVRARCGWRLPVVLLGFSQGASMAWRAAVLAGHEIAALAALAGDVPPELAELPAPTPFPRRALIARGADDNWYDAAKLDADRARLAGRGIELEALVFPGGHEWSDGFRGAVSRLLAEVAAQAERDATATR